MDTLRSRTLLAILLTLVATPFLLPPAQAAGTCQSPAFRANAYPSYSRGYVSTDPGELDDWWYFDANVATFRLVSLTPGANVDLHVYASDCTTTIPPCHSMAPAGVEDTCTAATHTGRFHIQVVYVNNPGTGSIFYQLEAVRVA